jgi:hypothetical protein
MAKGFYCNVNLIDMITDIDNTAAAMLNNGKWLSSIKHEHHEHHTIMIVDSECASGQILLKTVLPLEFYAVD